MSSTTTESSVIRVEVFRPEPGQTYFVRVLSDSYDGLITHYFQKRSRYCPGETCLPAMHRLDRIWKGYAAAMLFVERTRKWRPIVLELTESMELDVRGLYQRGQLWELVRPASLKGEISICRCILREDDPPANLAPAFDFVPVIKALYHVHDLTLGYANPQAPRVILAEEEGDVPLALRDKIDREDAQRKAYEEKARKAQERGRAEADRRRRQY